jgi:hypothetical protein
VGELTLVRKSRRSSGSARRASRLSSTLYNPISKAVSAQIRQLILHISHSKGLVDGFVGELTFAKRLEKRFVGSAKIEKEFKKRTEGVASLKYALQPYLSESVYRVVLQRSIPIQIRQLILYIRNIEGQVDGCMGELTSARKIKRSARSAWRASRLSSTL